MTDIEVSASTSPAQAGVYQAQSALSEVVRSRRVCAYALACAERSGSARLEGSDPVVVRQRLVREVGGGFVSRPVEKSPPFAGRKVTPLPSLVGPSEPALRGRCCQGGSKAGPASPVEKWATCGRRALSESSPDFGPLPGADLRNEALWAPLRPSAKVPKVIGQADSPPWRPGWGPRSRSFSR